MNKIVKLLFTAVCFAAGAVVAETPAATERSINVWYPGETVGLRMNDRRIRQDGQYDLVLTDWRERTVLTRAYDPKASGRIVLSESEVGSFGAFRVEIVERGTTNGPVAKTWFARLRSKGVKPVKWIGTHAHMQRWAAYNDGRFIDMLAAAGVGLVRDDCCWHQSEGLRGVYRPWLPYEFWFNELEKRGIGMVVLLSLWCVPGCYADTKDLSGFPGFCAFVAERFRGRNCVYEIYNEPQNSALVRSESAYGEKEWTKDSMRRWMVPMMEAARKSAAAIHEVDPKAVVYVLGEDTEDLLKDMIKLDVATANEGISFHPYVHSTLCPERSYWMRDNGAEIRALAKEHGGATRFCATENGIPTTDKKRHRFHAVAGNFKSSTYMMQANCIARIYLMTRLTGLDFTCQFNWMDEGNDPGYTEHNFGQLFNDCTPKPAFAATATLARLVGRTEAAREKSTEPDKWRMGEFERTDKNKMVYACWSVEGEIRVDWPSALDGTLFLDLMGNEIPAPKTEDGKLRLDDSPIYAVRNN